MSAAPRTILGANSELNPSKPLSPKALVLAPAGIARGASGYPDAGGGIPAGSSKGYLARAGLTPSRNASPA
jgi:hypothetical protein